VAIAELISRATLACFLGAASAAGQAYPTKPAPTPDSLAGITRRGVALAQYDFVAWHATDAVMALHPSTDEITGYIARRVDSTWAVAFGRLSAAQDSFLVAYEARQVVAKPDSFVVARHPRTPTYFTCSCERPACPSTS
jgi:hypothetical protein